MTPQKKCVSLETAKKLLAAGFPQDTERWFIPDKEQIGYGLFSTNLKKENGWIAAPNAQEIGIELPEVIHAEDGSYQFGQRKEHGAMTVFYWNPSGTKKAWSFLDEAEARAAAYLWLKERKLV